MNPSPSRRLAKIRPRDGLVCEVLTARANTDSTLLDLMVAVLQDAENHHGLEDEETPDVRGVVQGHFESLADYNQRKRCPEARQFSDIVCKIRQAMMQTTGVWRLVNIESWKLSVLAQEAINAVHRQRRAATISASTFRFQDLPREIRERVYYFLFCGRSRGVNVHAWSTAEIRNDTDRFDLYNELSLWNHPRPPFNQLLDPAPVMMSLQVFPDLRDRPIFRWKQVCDQHSPLNIYPEILRTCHKVHNEAEAILYSVHHWQFSPENLMAFIPFMREVSPRGVSHMTSISLEIIIPNGDESRLDDWKGRSMRLHLERLCEWMIKQNHRNLASLELHIRASAPLPRDFDFHGRQPWDFFWIRALIKMRGLRRVTIDRQNSSFTLVETDAGIWDMDADADTEDAHLQRWDDEIARRVDALERYLKDRMMVRAGGIGGPIEKYPEKEIQLLEDKQSYLHDACPWLPSKVVLPEEDHWYVIDNRFGD